MTEHFAYLAGPMRGIPEYNFPLFRRAAEWMRDEGWNIYSPAERDIEEDGFNPQTDVAKDIAYYMQFDLPAVCRSVAIVMLDGWEDSKGATLELHVARECGKQVYFLHEQGPGVGHFTLTREPALKRHPNSARFHEILSELGELHDRKQADYGRGDDPFANVRSSEEWGTSPWVGAMIRLNDKITRLKSLVANGKLENESAEDSLRDISVYSVIALVLYEQEVLGK